MMLVCLWHHLKTVNSIAIVYITNCTYTASVEYLVFCKQLYTVQSTAVEIFTHIYSAEVLKLKDSQEPFTSNSKTFKTLFCFQGLSRSWKKTLFQGLLRKWPPQSHVPVSILCKLWQTYGNQTITFSVKQAATIHNS